jgi:hypothetical protein
VLGLERPWKDVAEVGFVTMPGVVEANDLHDLAGFRKHVRDNRKMSMTQILGLHMNGLVVHDEVAVQADNDARLIWSRSLRHHNTDVSVDWTLEAVNPGRMLPTDHCVVAMKRLTVSSTGDPWRHTASPSIKRPVLGLAPTLRRERSCQSTRPRDA